MAAAAKVVSVQGEVFARSPNGIMRRLGAGDSIEQGEIVISSVGGAADLLTADGQKMSVNSQESFQFGPESALSTAPSAGEAAVVAGAPAQTVIQPGEVNVEQVLADEAAAAGLGGGGENGGSSFVRLMRISEELTPLSYEFPNSGAGALRTVESVGGDDAPLAGATVAGLNEDGLAGGNPGGIGDAGVDVPTSLVGVMNYSFGADGPAEVGAFRWVSVTAADYSDIYSGGQLVQYEISTDGLTLRGFIQGENGEIPVFELVVTDSATGAYSLTLLRPLDHVGANEDDINFTFNYQLTDHDGDTANGTLAVTVDDDTPVLLSGETDEYGNVVNGTIFSTGGDYGGDYGEDSGANSTVDSWSFTVNQDGPVTIDIRALENQSDLNGDGERTYLDSYIYVFRNDNGQPGELVFSNDDGDEDGFGDGSTHDYDSFGNLVLPAGEYILRIGSYYLSEDEARAGVNDYNSGNGDYQVTFGGDVTVTSGPGGGTSSGPGDTIRLEEESAPGLLGNNEQDGLSYTASGTIVDDVSWGADGFGAATAFKVGDTEFAIPQDGSSTAYFDADGAVQGDGESAAAMLVVNSDGTYTFTVLTAMNHALVQGENILYLPAITVTGVDGDGDPVGVPLNISIQDDKPELVSYGEDNGESSYSQLLSERATVDEDDIRTDLSLGTSPNDGNHDGSYTGDSGNNEPGPANVSGSVAALVSFGADGPGDNGFSLSSDLSGLYEQGLTSAGEYLSYRVEGDTLIAYVGTGGQEDRVSTARDEYIQEDGASERVVFTLQLGSDGQYTFNLYDQLDHEPPYTGYGEENQVRSLGYNESDPGNTLPIDLSSVIIATDADGDFVTLDHNFTIDVTDDVPAAGRNWTVQLEDDDLNGGLDSRPPLDRGDDLAPLFTSGTLSHQYGADEAGGSLVLTGVGGLPEGFTSSLDEDGLGLTISQQQGESSVAVLHVTLSDDTSGSYQVEQLHNILHPSQDGIRFVDNTENNVNFTVNYLVTDGDGDTARSSFNINVDDDMPRVTQATVIATVDEDDIASRTLFDRDNSASSQGNHPNDNNADGSYTGSSSSLFDAGPANVSGSVASLVSMGADGGTFGLSLPQGGMPVLKSNGDSVSYSISTDGHTLTASAGVEGSRTVFTLQVDGDGDYTFKLYDQLDHTASGQGDSIPLNLSSFIVATDGDGDSVRLSSGFTINVTDDAPEQVPGLFTFDRPNIFGITEEEQLAGGNNELLDLTNYKTATGSVANQVAFGADDTGAFSLGSTTGLPVLTSGGVAVTYSVVGDTLTAKAGELDVFTFKLESDGDFTFTLKGPLDHSGAGEDWKAIDLSSVIKATDFDGDSITLANALQIQVIDDIPVLKTSGGTDTVNVNEDDLRVRGAEPTGNDTTPEALVVSGNIVDNVKWGADGFGKATSVSWTGGSSDITGASTTVYFSAAGAVQTGAAGAAASLVVRADGTYTFTLSDNLLVSGQGENVVNLINSSGFTIAAQDKDGDAVQGGIKLYINVTDDVPTVSTNAPVQLDDDALAGGNAGGTGDDANAANTSGTLGHSYGADGGSIAWQTSGAPSGFSYVADGSNLLVKQGATTVMTLTLNAETGAYVVTQNAPVMHAAGQDENNQAFAVSYKVTDGDGDTATGTLNINVDDDTPIANNDAVSAVEGGTAGKTYNLMLIVDRSGSMSQSEMQQEVTALNTLLDKYASVALGGAAGVQVQVVTFAGSASLHDSAPVSIAQAKAYLDTLDNSGGSGTTNYDAAVAAATPAINGWAAANAGHANVVYFLSDGVPNPDSTALSNSEEAAWEATLAAKGATAWAIGVGTTNAADDDLADIAFPDAGHVIVVDSFSGLVDSMVGTVPPATIIEGSVLSGATSGNDAAGADGWATIVLFSATFGSDTYNFTSATDAHTFNLGTVGSVVMKGDGSYSFTPATDVKDDVTANISYTVQDADGDKSTATLSLTTTDRSEVSASNDTATVTEGHYYQHGTESISTVVTTPASESWSTSATSHNVSGFAYVDPNNPGSAQTANSTSFTVSANGGHPATVEFDIHVQGFQSGDLVKVDLMQGSTVVQTTGFVAASDNNVQFTNITTDGTYYLRVSGDDNSSNGDLKAWIDSISYTSYTHTYTPESTQTVTVSAPDLAWVDGGVATGHVMSNDSPGSEGAVVALVDGIAIAASGNTSIVGDYGTLSINANGDYTYTPNATDNLAGVQDVFSYTLQQPDGDSAIANLTVSFTDYNYTPTAGSNTFLGGEDGNDTLTGDSSQEVLYGGAGTDTLRGNDSNDHLVGGTGDDQLYGGASGDILEGGKGSDTLWGGTGTSDSSTDVFKWSLADASSSAVPVDTIKDFNTAAANAGGDILDLKDLLQAESHTAASLDGYLNFSVTGGTTTIEVHSGGAAAPVDQKIVLENVDLTQGGLLSNDQAIISDLLTKGKLITDA